MNKIRRKSLQAIIDQLEELKGSLEDLQAEEEEYRDNIPENMQESERYEKADEAPWTVWKKLSAALTPLSSERSREHDKSRRLPARPRGSEKRN